VTKGQSAHEEIAAGIRKRILSGDLAPGDRAVASLDAAAAEHGVAVGTVREALRLLAGDGLVVTRPGKGSFVIAADLAADGTEGGAPISLADVRKLQEDVAGLKADVAELQSQRGISRGRKRERSNEKSG
jgi:DNA-binding FadR family transcriptional regulator